MAAGQWHLSRRPQDRGLCGPEPVSQLAYRTHSHLQPPVCCPPTEQQPREPRPQGRPQPDLQALCLGSPTSAEMPQEVPCTLLCKALGLRLLPCYPSKTARWTSGLLAGLTSPTTEAKECSGGPEKAAELGSAAHPTGQCVCEQGHRRIRGLCSQGAPPQPQPQDVRPAGRTGTRATMK